MEDPAARAPRTLEDMHGDGLVRCMTWFDAYAQELPSPVCDKLRAISTALFVKHMRATLVNLFKVPQGDVEATIQGALPDVDKVEAISWRRAIEEQAGFSFATANVPASAALARSTAPSVAISTESRIKHGHNTISDHMLTAGPMPNSPIDESCFEVFTNDITLTTVCETELSTFTDCVVAQFAGQQGKTNMGQPLLKAISKQAHRRIKFLPKYGKTLGKDRQFHRMVYDKTTNRKYVSLPHHHPHGLACSLSHSPHRPRPS